MSYKLILLTKGQIARVSVEDFEDVVQFKWCSTNNQHPKSEAPKWYAVRRKNINGKQVRIYLHRYLIEKIYNIKLTKASIVDHINGDSLDYTRENLRVTDVKTNCGPWVAAQKRNRELKKHDKL